MTKVTFNCDLCGKKTEQAAWHKKRERHYCSRDCANKHQAILHGSGISKKEYERLYWGKPENKARRKIAAKLSQQKRSDAMGNSYIKMMLNRCKERAARKGIEFSITIADIALPKICPILGLELRPARKQGGAHNSPSVDRIDNSKGYIKGNIRIISKRANSIKCDASFEEIEKFYLFIKSFQTEVPQ